MTARDDDGAVGDREAGEHGRSGRTHRAARGPARRCRASPARVSTGASPPGERRAPGSASRAPKSAALRPPLPGPGASGRRSVSSQRVRALRHAAEVLERAGLATPVGLEAEAAVRPGDVREQRKADRTCRSSSAARIQVGPDCRQRASGAVLRPVSRSSCTLLPRRARRLRVPAPRRTRPLAMTPLVRSALVVLGEGLLGERVPEERARRARRGRREAGPPSSAPSSLTLSVWLRKKGRPSSSSGRLSDCRPPQDPRRCAPPVSRAPGARQHQADVNARACERALGPWPRARGEARGRPCRDRAGSCPGRRDRSRRRRRRTSVAPIPGSPRDTRSDCTRSRSRPR